MLLNPRRLFVAALLLFLLSLTCLRVVQFSDPDFWWHLRTGQIIVETHTIPHADSYSYTRAGAEWVTHEWLAEAAMYFVFRICGYIGLVVFFTLVITAALWIAFRRCHASPYAAGAATVLGALAMMGAWGVRPQMLSFLLTSVYLALLRRYAQGGSRRLLYGLVPLMLLWANLHGAFALGLTLIALTALGLVLDGWADEAARADVQRRVLPLALAFIACLCIVVLNPQGLRLFSYPLETLASSAQQTNIQEWVSPNFHELVALPLALLLFLTLAVLALSPRRPRISELLLLVFSGYMALRSVRHINFFALVAIPILAEHLPLCLRALHFRRWLQWSEKPLLIIAVSALLMFPITAFLRAIKHEAATHTIDRAPDAPVAAVEYLQTRNLSGPVFNTYEWGGYLIWKFYPQAERRVFIDGRADVYGDAFLEEFVRTERGEGDWQAVLTRYHVRTALLKPDKPLASLLRQATNWVKVYEDQQAVIFTTQAQPIELASGNIDGAAVK